MASLFYLAVVFFLLFFGLGQRSLSGSEDRWAEIARNMLVHRDWFHPTINGEVYFDKPLLSYWLIGFFATLTQTLNEFIVRLPGALAGLLTLFCSYKIAHNLFDRCTAWLCCCLIITSYGFLFWTHTASAEISNMALITAAVAWFVDRRERTDFSSYLVFYVICAVGSQLKGLTAVVVPLLVIAPWLLREGRWRAHVNVYHLAALVVAALFFLLPYLGASLQPLPPGVEAQRNQLSGIDLLIRENIVRFFNPFDHDDPFYSYLYEVPRIVFPWAFLLIAALLRYVPKYAAANRSERWLLDALALVFFFFTLSGSRRWYYILPIMPFCMMLIAAYLAAPEQHRWRRPALVATQVVLYAIAALLIALPVGLGLYAKGTPLPAQFWVGSAAMLLAGALIAAAARGKRAAIVESVVGVSDAPSAKSLSALLLLAVIEMTVVFGLVLPGVDSYRQLKPFAQALTRQLQADDTLTFYRHHNTALVFYLNPPQTIAVIDNRAQLAGTSGRRVIVAEEANKEALFADFPELRSAVPLTSTQSQSQKLFSEKSKLLAYRLP
jgi:4-amino-4-deoxy-L-arabinose transferase-like glycosyltransferase